MRVLRKLWAFLKRDFQSAVSYRFAFVFQLLGMFLSVAAFYFASKMIDPGTKGLEGFDPFPWLLVGMAFQFYFSTALYSFSSKIRDEQVLGTLEAMLVSPTPTSIVIFSSAAWDFCYGALRVLVYLLAATLIFGVRLHTEGLGALAVGIALTLLSFAGIGILSASFILYFKRGNPINFFLSALTTFFGNVFFPREQLPDSIQWVSDFLPITWSLRIVRGTLLQGKSFDELGWDLGLLALITAILIPAGVVVSRLAIRRAMKEGSLVQY
jgi:ABC-2 type transport system permease protein